VRYAIRHDEGGRVVYGALAVMVLAVVGVFVIRGIIHARAN
jgi:hypothetical protein